MESMYKVSVIVPVFKVEAYIERCVRSLFGQTLDSIQYVFVNDASPDNSIGKIKDVLKEYPQREKQCLFLEHVCNKGVSAARNTGLSTASGEYILYCDSDDWGFVQVGAYVCNSSQGECGRCVWQFHNGTQ